MTSDSFNKKRKSLMSNKSRKSITSSPKDIDIRLRSAMMAQSNQNNYGYKARKSLTHRGIVVTRKIAATLQGSIYRGKYTDSNGKIYDVAIKRADVVLTRNGVGRTRNQKYCKVAENISKEYNLMQYISNNKYKPKGILKPYKFINDGINYFIVMEYGGTSLFRHVMKYHSLIKQNIMSIDEWGKHVKIIFKQMCIILNYLHNKVHCCHLDISLENFTIDNTIFKNGKFIKHGNIYLIDYGLSEYFGKNNASFECSKFVGKVHCQSPEIRSRNVFNAQLSDIWSLGCVLFMMLMNSLPMNVASKNDEHFCNIVNGHLKQMLLDTNKIQYIDSECIDLLNKMLTIEKKRINIKNIVKHKYYLL
mmetsp:Transcript_23152/g.28402  ORF Transcript_23152/g.28402 Transcript_23152/m.28402 type:complete len:362 (+) Transcript_23152:23-1108(+)